jgi:hypothetical protein
MQNRIEAESLQITASARMPNGNPYKWTISLPVSKVLKLEDYLVTEVNALLRDFPDLVEAYLKDTE